MTRPSTTRAIGAFIIGASLIAVTAPAATAAPSGTQQKAPFAFAASAWGSTVKVAPPLVGAGKSAYVSLGCTQSTNKEHSNSTVATDVPGIGQIGAVATTVMTTRVKDALASTGRSTTAASSLLGEEIEIGAIDATARASHDSTGYHATVDVSIASLTIGGTEVELTGGKQHIDVPGVAEITVANQRTTELARQAKAKVTAITVRLLDSGAVVKLGEARASLDGRNINALFSGGAFGTTAKVDDVVSSGRTANQPLACVGTQGKDVVNKVANVDLGPVGTAGNVVSTVNASQLPMPAARASNTIENVQLLDGLVQIEGITAAVQVTENADGSVDSSTAGTTIGSIHVGVLNIPVPAVGESVDLPGVGTLTFGESTRLAGGRGLQVVGAEIHIDATDTDVVLSHAAATIK